MNDTILWILTAGILVLPTAVEGDESAIVEKDRLRTALERSIVFLQRDGRAWFDGELPVQHQACVSCHQVPTGTWGLSAAYDALQLPPSTELTALFEDGTKFAADKEVGRAAMWSQFLMVANKVRDPVKTNENDLFETYLPLILEDQQDTGAWPAKGQFPSQRRPIAESNAVVTMWMIRPLQLHDIELPAVAASLQRARASVEASDGSSTEWLAWRSLLADTSQPNAVDWSRRLVSQQHPDGSWGWAADEPGNAYATGVALYALAAQSQPVTRPSDSDKDHGTYRAMQQAARYLLTNQRDDGSWRVASRLVSKEGSESLDYVYGYWSTAWATLGLAELLNS